VGRFPRATQRGYEILSDRRDVLGWLIPTRLHRRADDVIRSRA
jgi:hypothetical protein